MAKITRKQLKQDRFVEEVGRQAAYFTAHRKQVLGAAVAILLGIVAAVSWVRYERSQEGAARKALYEAIRLYHGAVTTEQRLGFLTFATTGERIRRTSEAFDEVISEFGSHKQGKAAEYYLGLLEMEQEKLDEARKRLEAVVPEADEAYSSLARLALADLLARQGDAEGSRKHYQHLIDHPTRVVPANRAKLELARKLAESNPEEAKPILEELMAEPGPAAAAAGAALRRLEGAS